MVKNMKVLQINIFGNLSTGRIAVDLYNVLKNNGHQGLVSYIIIKYKRCLQNPQPEFRKIANFIISA